MKGVLRNFAKFRGKHLRQSLIGNKVAGLMPATLLKKILWHRCFPVNFSKLLRTPFEQNTSRRLLLLIYQKKCIAVGLSIVEGLLNFLFCCKSDIDQNAVQKTLTDYFGASLLLLELGCLRYVVLPYHLRMLLRVFMRI